MTSMCNISTMTTPALVVFLVVSLFSCSIGAQEDGVAVITAGKVLVLDCFVNEPDGGIDHDVIWFLDDVQVSNTSELTLTNLNHTHHGSNVTCYNGTAIVHTRIIHFHHETAFAVNSTLTLNCSTYPAAATSVMWYQSNKAALSEWVISNPDNVTSQLMIQNVTLDDAGVYSCVSSEGVTVKVYNISVGLFPREPSTFECFGCSEWEFTCEWSPIPDTHLPTEVTFEYKRYYGSDGWTICKEPRNTGCHISAEYEMEFRLNISNALGRISEGFSYFYAPYEHLTVPAPHISSVQPLSSLQLGVHWTASLCGISDTKETDDFIYKMECRNNYTNETEVRGIERMKDSEMTLKYANTVYCFRLQARTPYTSFGKWSEPKCNRTLPTEPNVDFERTDFTNTESEKGKDLRHITLTWKVKLDESNNQPFQGISYFELEVKQSETTVNETDGNSTSHSSLFYIYDLEGRSDYSLKQDTFSYTIPDLKKNEEYTIVLSAVNSDGSTETTLIVNALEEPPSAASGAQEDGIAVITAGEVLVLNCFVNEPDGGIDHDVIWFLDDVQVSNTSELTLTNLNHTHHGSIVTCSNRTAVVHTRIIHFHHETAFAVNSTLTLNCSTYPAAATSVTWHQSNKAASSEWVISNPDNVTSQLMIQNVTLDDAGVYSCVSSEGVTVKVYNISVGLFPREPSTFECFGCSEHEFTCKWSPIPDTHLPTEVTFEYKTYTWNHDPSINWTICKEPRNTGCHISSADRKEFRLNISNALGRISEGFRYFYAPYEHLIVPAPHISSVQPLSPLQLGVHWTASLCSTRDTRETEHFIYKMEYRNNYTNETEVRGIERMKDYEMPLEYSNTVHCFRLKARTEYTGYGYWSKWECNRTLPTEPNVDFERTDFTNIESEKGQDLRNITLTWKVKLDESNNQPFQGISYFELEVKQSETAVNETDGNSTSHSSLFYFYDLEGRSDYSLEQDTFSYTIPDLKKYEEYTIVLSAVNSDGSTKTTLIVNALEESVSSTRIIVGICVPLVIALILALLGFGFQRLKNNSRPIPEPVFRGVGDVKPTHVEHEVFDELPAMAKERQRQLLVSLSRESGDSQHESKGYRTSSSSSSGVGTDTSSLENGPVEKVPLLQTRNLSGSINRSPYSLLSELTPSTSNLRMAPDALDTDLDSLSPVSGQFLSIDEGISTGGSSIYQLQSPEDKSIPNPYYSVCSQVPVRVIEPGNDPGYLRCSDIRDHDHLLRSSDADDEASQPSTPATPNCAYYSHLSSRSDATSRDQSQDYCDPYVIAADMPSSPPLQLQSRNLATIAETPNNNVPQAAPTVMYGPNNSHLPSNSGYVDSTDIFTGRTTGMRDDSSDSRPSSSQSSPEHAVIIHNNPRRNSDPSSEIIDDPYLTSPSSTPLNSFLPASADGYIPVPSQAISNTSAPPGNGYVESPSASFLNSSSIRPKGSSGYVTHEQLPLVERPSLVEDSGQASEQPSQSPSHVSTSMPTLSTNADGYVPIAQIPAQNACSPANTSAQSQALETTSGYLDMSTLMPQSLPASNLSSEHSDLECEPFSDNHKQESPSGNPQPDHIPTPMLESVQESPLWNKDKEPVTSGSSAASHVNPNRQGTLPCVDEGYVSKDMTSLPCRTKPTIPLQLNNNGYVCIP